MRKAPQKHMGRDKARAAVYAMGGFYLIYLAYGLFQGREDMTENKLLFMGFMIFFGLVGAALIVLGIWRTYQLNKDDAQRGDTEDSSTEDSNTEEADIAAKLRETEADMQPEADMAMELKKEEAGVQAGTDEEKNSENAGFHG